MVSSISTLDRASNTSPGRQFFSTFSKEKKERYVLHNPPRTRVLEIQGAILTNGNQTPRARQRELAHLRNILYHRLVRYLVEAKNEG